MVLNISLFTNVVLHIGDQGSSRVLQSIVLGAGCRGEDGPHLANVGGGLGLETACGTNTCRAIWPSHRLRQKYLCNGKSSIMQLDNGFQCCCYSTCNLDFLLNGICIICCGFGLQRLVEAISFKSSYIIILGYILSFHSSVSQQWFDPCTWWQCSNFLSSGGFDFSINFNSYLATQLQSVI